MFTIIKGWSPHMRHVSRTLRVNLDWLFGKCQFEFEHFSDMGSLTNRSQTFFYEKFFHS